jgi:uncharacterized protein YjbJ (UPF0337 family)
VCDDNFSHLDAVGAPVFPRHDLQVAPGRFTEPDNRSSQRHRQVSDFTPRRNWHRACTFHPAIADGAIDPTLNRKEHSMNWDRVEGNWKQMTGKVKEQWGKLTDDALTQIGGRRDQLVGKIQEAYGISRDEADQQVKTWEKLN